MQATLGCLSRCSCIHRVNIIDSMCKANLQGTTIQHGGREEVVRRCKKLIERSLRPPSKTTCSSACICTTRRQDLVIHQWGLGTLFQNTIHTRSLQEADHTYTCCVVYIGPSGKVRGEAPSLDPNPDMKVRPRKRERGTPNPYLFPFMSWDGGRAIHYRPPHPPRPKPPSLPPACNLVMLAPLLLWVECNAE